MPAMPRMTGKARKIAYAILGKPANMTVKRTKAQEKLNRNLIYQETYRVR